MFNMEILTLFLLSVSLAASQQRNQNPRFRNPGFQNVRTPLATSAARDRPFISIPIVLLPDGRPLPKPKHSTYHYVGHATQQNNNGRQQNAGSNHQRNGKQPRQQVGRQAAVNYQVIIPPPQQQKRAVTKPPKLTASQLSGHIRSAQQPNNYAKHRGPAPQQMPQQQTFEQTQQMHQIQFVKQQQRPPAFQQQSAGPSFQSTAAHKQNVANFVNFATNLGAAITAQQQNQQVILPTQTPASGLTFNNQAKHKIAESYLSQRPLISNHKLNNGVTYQHQVPNTQAAHAHYTQVSPNNAENHNSGYAVHQQQQQQQQTSQQQQQQQQQQEQTQEHSQGSSQSESQYLSATSVRPNTHASNQGTDLQNNGAYQTSQTSAFQQSSNNSPRSQATQGNAALVASNFNSQLQQGNQQSYAVATPQQQSTPSSQMATSYGTQAQLPKGVLSMQQQSGASGLTLSSQNPQSSYVNQNQAAQQNQNSNSQSQQISYSNSPQTPSLGYSTAQVSQANAYTLQNVQANGGQINDPLSYFQYQTAQELPLNFPAIFNQAQSGYLSSTQNVQQNDPNSQELDQPYTILPSAQNLYASSVGPAIFVSPQQQEENTSSDSPSEIGVQTYEAYSNDQSTYPSSTNQGNQGSQGSYISAQNIEKNYQNSQFGFLLQNSHESQNAPNDGQLPQSASSLSTGQLLYDSSSPKQINYSPAPTSFSTQPQQQYSSANYQNSPTYISFAASNSNFKSESQPSINYGQQRPQGVVNQSAVNSGAVNAGGIVTPGSTYAKLNQNDVKQQESSEQSDEGQEDSDYDESEETNDDEASYKVVYIPLDILKNILSNSVENK